MLCFKLLALKSSVFSLNAGTQHHRLHTAEVHLNVTLLLQVWCALDERQAQTADGRRGQRLAALDECTCVVLICSQGYCQDTDASFRLEADLLQARQSPWTDTPTPHALVLAADASIAAALRKDARFRYALVHTLAAHDDGSARVVADAVTEGLQQRLGAPARVCRSRSYVAVTQLQSETSLAGKLRPSHDVVSRNSQNALRSSEDVQSWLLAHHPQSPYQAIHPAAWSVHDTAAWMESLGRRWQPFAMRALHQRLDGRILSKLGSKELAVLLTDHSCAGTTSCAPTPAMAQRAMLDIAQRCAACVRVGVTPSLAAFAPPLHRCGPVAGVAELRLTLQQLCKLCSTSGAALVPLDTLWGVLQMLGLDRLEARRACANLPTEQLYFVRCAEHTEALIAALDQKVG